MSYGLEKSLWDVTGYHIGLVFFITAIWVFAGIFFFLHFSNLCIEKDNSPSQNLKKYYYVPLVIGGIAAGSIFVSFFYNKSSPGHAFVLLITTFIFVTLIDAIYIFAISQPIHEEICPQTNTKETARQSGILLGFTMLGVFISLIITWLMFRNEAYYNFRGRINNTIKRPRYPSFSSFNSSDDSSNGSFDSSYWRN
jgi:hypothetical protein